MVDKSSRIKHSKKKVCKEKYRKIKQKVKSVRQKKLKRRRYFKQLNLTTRNVKAKDIFSSDRPNQKI